MSKTYLKIKIMSLAAEATIIRREERRWHRNTDVAIATRNGLRSHRVNEVRIEARAALVAYAYVRGRAYAQLEAFPLTPPRWDRVLILVRRYGGLPKLEAKDLEVWAKPEVEAKAAA